MVEYRVLSSAMMSTTAKLNFVWNQLQKALLACKRETLRPESDIVQEAINNSNVDLAKSLISSYNLA